MPTKTTTQNNATTTGKTSTATSQDNGAQATPNGKAPADDHLTKANKAMKRAWELIAQRKGDQA